MIWFTSDIHLGHEKALDFTCRPWNQIDEMNEGIIANINEKVKENDELYILGDYSFKITALEAAALRKKIYCKKVHLVPGNHDKDWNNKLVQGTFIVEQPITVLKIDGRKYVLSHFPMADWQSMSHESIHLHGHIHSEGSLYNEMNRMQGFIVMMSESMQMDIHQSVWKKFWHDLTEWNVGAESSGRTG